MDVRQLKAKYVPRLVGLGVNLLSIPAPQTAASVAMDIFRTPRKGRVESYQKKFLKKFIRKDLVSNGHVLATYDDGREGRTVLLCHGWESNSYRWRKLYRHLKDEALNIVMMDAPAHGASGSDRFDAVLYAAAIQAAVDYYEPSIIIGHSVGGYATLHYAGSENLHSSVRSLIIMASPDRFVDISTRYFEMVRYRDRVRDSYWKLAEAMYGRPPEAFSVADAASRLHIPGLIIHDDEDTVNLPYEGAAIHRAWSKSRLLVTSGLGHSLQDVQVYDAIKAYLTRDDLHRADQK